MKTITGGICAAKGYKAAGIHCGIRKNKSKKDLSLIISEKPASAAAVYTTNLVKGAPLLVTKKHISNGVAQAIICNSGNANTCNSNGIEIEVDTKKEFRRIGLAKACAARLILECLSRGLYPSWDAQNKISLHLAKSLGYTPSYEYDAYELIK